MSDPGADEETTMFGQGEDRHTNTVEDAGRFEFYRSGGGIYGREDVPSAADLAEDAALDRQAAARRQQAEAAARARGEYVPGPGMAMEASSLGMALAQRRVSGMEATAVRDGVLRVAPANRHHPEATAEQTVEALRDYYGDRAEVAMGEGCVWVKVTRTFLGDPFMTETGVAGDEPPF